MQKITLEEASDEQIRAFARTFLQLESADALAIKPLRAKVSEAWPQNFIWLADAPTAIQVAPAPMPKEEIEKRAGQGIAASSSKGDPIVVLTLHKLPGPGGADPVFLCVNGVAMHVARGIKQKVPYRYFEALIHTVQRLHDQDDRTFAIKSEDVLRFPMTPHIMPSEDEIFEFFRLDAERAGQDLTRAEFDARREKNERDAARASIQDDNDRRENATASARATAA